MVLVGHYAVEPGLVGHGVLLVVLVVEMMGLLRVEVGVGEVQPPGVVLSDVLLVELCVGLLGMEKDFYGVFHIGLPVVDSGQVRRGLSGYP